MQTSIPWSTVSAFIIERMTVIRSLKGCVFILLGELAVFHCLSNSFRSNMFISKESWFHLHAFFQKQYNFFYRMLPVSYSFIGTVHFCDIKIPSHPILQTYFLSAYFRAFLIKAAIVLAASFALKWEQLLKQLLIFQNSYPANKLRNNYVFFGHFLVTNKRN